MMDIAQFTTTEDVLLKRVKACIERSGRQTTCREILGLRLWDWRFWIGDVVLYLHELKNFVEKLEAEFPEGISKSDMRKIRLAKPYGNPIATPLRDSDTKAND